MVECKNCPYFYKGEDDDFCYCHFEGDYLAPCEEDYYEDKDCDDWDKYDKEEDYEGEPYKDEPVYENEQLDNMTDEDLEQELNSEEDFDDEKVFE